MSAGSSETSAVAASPELFAPVRPDVELCYQTFGDPDDEPLLLVMGLGGPMTWWDEELCRMLAAAGFYVIRYDNRDTGRSSRLEGRVTRVALVRAFTGRRVRPPYTMADLASDAFGLLDHLGLDAAHVAGVSMGGMIVQTMAISEPRRVLSMTSIMSTTGRRTVGWQHPNLLPALIGNKRGSREAYVRASRQMWRLIGSPGYPEPEEETRRRAEETWDRGISAEGTMRQMLAILTQPDRSARLRSVRVPTTVIHGLADRMVHVSGGRATARAVPGAELLLIDGMGHDTPPALFETFTAAIRRTADRAGAPRS
ncbi:alpha/beta hydrolase [Nocardioides sp. IC4_145]|uniref:alpha/beta fold hydrolase n=1 Tax=Nocardioides sp. IC4_145 TaxID=2714037 RepID=UPI00140D29C0|nr:alpha/beta hydrolase [Nocardioides sp. IC4_145]NHC23680.1 alpha/beta hydrolase [Nocardioides sp. IC4_145]